MTTPYYLLEESKLRRNLALIKDVANRSGAEIILAFKAFALWKTFPIFREYISHTTASSPDEARLAFEEFGSPAHTYSPAYTEKDFPEILRCSSHITFNSLSQFHRFRPIPDLARPQQKSSVSVAQEGLTFSQPVDSFDTRHGGEASGEREELGHTQLSPSFTGGEWGGSFGLRVNPEYSEIETELYNPCAPGSRFGVLAEDLPDQLPPELEGFHIHCHCESGADAFARTLIHIENKFSRWFPQLKWINFGGGHLMTRRDYDVELLVRTLRDFHRRYPHLRMILEPGSAFAWQTGCLVSSVVDIVENHGIKTAILDVSFTCHMPDCLEMPYYPEVKVRKTSSSLPLNGESGHCLTFEGTVVSQNISTPLPHNEGKGGGPAVYRLGGNSCLSGDYMGYWQFPKPLSVGDEIIFEDMIHYTTVKTNTFNGVHHPSIVMQHMDGSMELLREFHYEDYRDRMD